MSPRTHCSRPTRGTRSLVAIGGLAVLAVGIIALGWLQIASPRVTDDAEAPGRLVSSSQTVDLGRVPFDQPAEAHFELANTGANTVRLTGAPKVQMLEGC